MSYIINNSRGQIVAVIPDGVVNTSATNLALIGQAVTNYGTYQNENYLYLLENFASGTAPTTPILGQLWYNANTDTLHSYNSANTWSAIASQAYVDTALTASLISPTFSGTPTAPTASSGTNTNQIATTAFVNQSIGNVSGNINVNGYITSTSPLIVLTGGTTLDPNNNYTQLQWATNTASPDSGKNQYLWLDTDGVHINTYNSGIYDNQWWFRNDGNLDASGNINVSGNITSSVTESQVIIANVIICDTELATNGIIANSLSVTTNQEIQGNLVVNGNITGGNLVVNSISANSITTTGTTSAFRLPNLTQTQINALSPQNGDMVYNTTTNLSQVYQNGSWNNFTLSYYV